MISKLNAISQTIIDKRYERNTKQEIELEYKKLQQLYSIVGKTPNCIEALNILRNKLERIILDENRAEEIVASVISTTDMASLDSDTVEYFKSELEDFNISNESKEFILSVLNQVVRLC